MGQSIHFAMQTYRRDLHGHLAKGQWKACLTADDARRRAEAVVLSGKSIGAVALSQRSSGEFDEGELAITIAAFGEVPHEARDRIPF